MFLNIRRSGWPRTFVVTTMAAVALAAYGGGSDDKTAATDTPATSSVLAPAAVSQAARVQEIKSLTLTAASAQLTTGEAGSSTQLTATALDSMGMPVVGALIRFSVDEFSFIGHTDVLTDALGVATATITSAGNKMNRSSVAYATAVASIDGTKALRGKVEISASGTRIVAPESAPLHRYGITRIPVKVVDSDGVGIPGAFMDFVTEEGVFTDWIPETDADGTVWLSVSNPSKQDNTIKVRVAEMNAEFLASIEQIKPGDLSFRFGQEALIRTGASNNSVAVLVHVQRADESPMAETPITFSASESGAILERSTTTDSHGDASVRIGAGSDLSNRSIDVVAEVLGASAKLAVPVRYTTLSVEVAPLMTNMAKPVWTIVARDGLGNPIVNANIDVNFSVLPAENSVQFTPVDPSTFTSIGAPLTKPDPKIAQIGSADRSYKTDASGKARIEFGALPDALVGQVVQARVVYGKGKQTFAAKQHVYAGLVARDSQETILSDNLLTETKPFRYDAKLWHRLFLVLPNDTLYESLNAKGPTARDDQCTAGYSKITVRAGGQDIVLRGTKISSHTCDMEWGGDFFGFSNAGRTGFASSDFRIWYVASDNKDLPNGVYVAPMRLSVVESEPATGNDIFWGNKDIVVFITNK